MTPRRKMVRVTLFVVVMLRTCLVKSSAKIPINITPAMFVFGDSLVDVGNNNYLPLSVIKADFPHNGIDFPTHKANGRFSNGKNAADFLAEKLGIPIAPPYLSMLHNHTFNFVAGVNFASGGAGVLDTTNPHFSIVMNKQIEYYATIREMMVQKLGQEDFDKIISKSMFVIVVGSNDILDYFESSHSNQNNMSTPQQLVDSMILNIKYQLKNIYNLGGRKFGVFGVGAVGCCPSQRSNIINGDCNEEANYWALNYNQRLIRILEEYKMDLDNFQYSYIDAYNILLNIVQHPSTYGFKEVKGACCGLGDLNAKVPCIPISSYCSNRSNHVFWDLFHPTEATYRIVVESAFNGPPQYTFPINIQQLVSS